VNQRFAWTLYGLFPVLAAWYSVLSLAAGNLRAAGHVQQLGLALLLATIVGLLGWLVSGLLTRDDDRRTILGVAFVVWFAGYATLVRPVRDIGVSPTVAFVFTLAVLTGFTAVVLRAGPAVHAAGRLMRATVVIVLAFPLFSFASAQLQDRTAGRSAEAKSAEAYSVASAETPSIFLIVLDKYTGSGSLLMNYGFDNTPFEERLRGLGFVVPGATRSNYPHTWMTLASMLNWSFLDEIYGESRPGSTRELNRAIENNRTWRFLKERGYEFVFLPSTFHTTQSNASPIARSRSPPGGACTLPPHGWPRARRMHFRGSSEGESVFPACAFPIPLSRHRISKPNLMF
jgi:hypothetical protein